MSKKLQRNDTIHNIFLGEVGKWLPWDPKPHQVQDQEYAEDQLNMLMKNYKDNEESRDKFMSDQRNELLKGAKKAGPTTDLADSSQSSEGAGGSSEGWGSMFDGPADLALQRKKGAATSAATSTDLSGSTPVATPVAAPVAAPVATPTNQLM
jgi:hypothetical protein